MCTLLWFTFLKTFMFNLYITTTWITLYKGYKCAFLPQVCILCKVTLTYAYRRGHVCSYYCKSMKLPFEFCFLTKSVVHWIVDFMAKQADVRCSHRAEYVKAEVETEMFCFNLKSKIHRQWVLFVSVRLKLCQNTHVQTIQKFFDFGDVWEGLFSWTLAPLKLICYVDKMKVMFLSSKEERFVSYYLPYAWGRKVSLCVTVLL